MTRTDVRHVYGPVPSRRLGRSLGLDIVPFASLTNDSLLWRLDVSSALLKADIVLPSLDAGDEQAFRLVNRPHKVISFTQMVEGLTHFTDRFAGQVWLEVLLLAGVTGTPSAVEKIAALARRIAPARIQLNTAFRPPAEPFAVPLSEAELLAIKKFFPGEVDVIHEQDEGGAGTVASVPAQEDNILALLGRRPCTVADVARGLRIHLTEALKHLDALAGAGKISTTVTEGRRYYIGAGPGEVDDRKPIERPAGRSCEKKSGDA